jgi:hypothetical protein
MTKSRHAALHTFPDLELAYEKTAEECGCILTDTDGKWAKQNLTNRANDPDLRSCDSNFGLPLQERGYGVC